MVKVIPARIEDGRIVTDEALPEASVIESVSVTVRLKASAPQTAEPYPTLAELRGILKGKVRPCDMDLEREYIEYLEAKYQ